MAPRSTSPLRLPYTDENRLEVLPCSSPGAPVHVALQPIDEPELAASQDLGIQVAPVVDDDDHGRAVLESIRAAPENPRDATNVVLDRCPTRSSSRGAKLTLPSVVETEDLVGIAMLLVVVD